MGPGHQPVGAGISPVVQRFAQRGEMWSANEEEIGEADGEVQRKGWQSPNTQRAESLCPFVLKTVTER